MQYPSYVPQPDSLFASWLANFAALLTAAPALYGLAPADATAADAANDAFAAAYALAINPPTRTSGTIAAKDAARAEAEAIVRPLAVKIINNASVNPQDKVNIGVTVPAVVSTPVPPPTTSPSLILVSAVPLAHNLQFRDSTTPLLKAKPFGVVGLELWCQQGVSAGIDPEAAAYCGNYNKTPFQVVWPSTSRGKHSTYWARWVTRSGPGGVPQRGPWSSPLDTIIV